MEQAWQTVQTERSVERKGVWGVELSDSHIHTPAQPFAPLSFGCF